MIESFREGLRVWGNLHPFLINVLSLLAAYFLVSAILVPIAVMGIGDRLKRMEKDLAVAIMDIESLVSARRGSKNDKINSNF